MILKCPVCVCEFFCSYPERVRCPQCNGLFNVQKIVTSDGMGCSTYYGNGCFIQPPPKQNIDYRLEQYVEPIVEPPRRENYDIEDIQRYIEGANKHKVAESILEKANEITPQQSDIFATVVKPWWDKEYKKFKEKLPARKAWLKKFIKDNIVEFKPKETKDEITSKER